MDCYVKIFFINDGYKDVEERINQYLRQTLSKTKITSISQLGEYHVIVVFEKGR